MEVILKIKFPETVYVQIAESGNRSEDHTLLASGNRNNLEKDLIHVGIYKLESVKQLVVRTTLE
jgi:hypothetical protein